MERVEQLRDHKKEIQMSNLLKKFFFVYMIAATVVWTLAGVVTPVNAATTLNVGDMFKTANNSAVYVKVADGKKVFTDAPVHHTYFANWNGIKIVTLAEMQALPLRGVMSVRTGAKLIHFVDNNSARTPIDNMYYAVENGNVLRAVSDSVGTALYGANWKTRAIGVFYSEMALYSTGTALSTMYPAGTLVKVGDSYYVIDANNTKRLVTAAGLTANNYITSYAVTAAALTGYAEGSQVTVNEPALWTLTTVSAATPPSATIPAGLTVALAADNPIAANVPVGSSELVKVLNVNFTASNDRDITVTGLNVRRSGLSADSDITNVYLMDGSHVIATNLGVNMGVINFSDGSGLFTVRAGQTKEISVAASLATASITYGFAIENAAAVTAANVTVNGAFPVAGNILTGSTVSNLGGVQVTNSSSGTTAPGLSINAGQTNFTVGQFALLAQNQAVQIRSLTFTMTGSVASSDISNIKLMNGGTQLGSTVTSFGANNTVTFDLSAAPLALSSGQTAQIYLYADVLGGVNRYFQFSIQHNYDVIAQDMMFNIGILPTLNTGSYPTNMSYVSVSAGTLTVTRNAASPTQNILPGGTNQTIAKFDLRTAGEAVRVTAVQVDLAGTNAGIISSHYITNLKLVDDQGTQIGTTVTTVTTATTPANYSSLNYVIPINTTRVLSVIIDLSSSATGNVKATLQGVTGQGFTSLSSVGPFSQVGNILVSNNTLLSANSNTALSAVSTVAGAPAVKVASFALVAGAVSGVTVTNIALKTPAAAYTATTSASFQNLMVKIGETQIGQTYGTLVDNTSYNFTAATPIAITAGSQVIVDVYADAKTGSTFTAAPVIALAQYGVSAVAAMTNQAITTVPANAVNGQNVTINSAGTLTYSLFNSPIGAYVPMGLTGASAVKLASYQVTGSASEDMLITNVYLTATSSAVAAYKNFTLKLNGTSIGQGLNLTGSNPYTLSWVGLNARVTRNSNPILEVYAETNDWQTLQATGATIRASILSFDYQGASSGQATTAYKNVQANQFTLYRTVVNAAMASGVAMSGGVSDAAVVGAWTFSSNASDVGYIQSMTLAHVYAGALVTALTTTLNVFDADTNQQVGTASVTTSSSAGVLITLDQNSAATGGPAGAAGLAINAGATRTLYLKANLTTAGFSRATAGSPISYQTIMSTWTWHDGSTGSLGPNPTLPLPVNGTANSLNL